MRVPWLAISSIIFRFVSANHMLLRKKSEWPNTCAITSFWISDEFDSSRCAWHGSLLTTIS